MRTTHKEKSQQMKKTSRGLTSPSVNHRSLAAATALVAGATFFGAVVLPSASGASSSPTTISVSQNKTWGPTLTLKNGDTVYRLTADSKNMSVCTGKCATIWIPVLLKSGQKTPIGDGVSGLGSFSRAGGTHQVTFQGIPLYTFFKDKKPGQVTGNVKDTWGQWWSINPKSPHTAPKKIGGSGGTTTTTAGGGIAY
jgi:predicted lipoprotein with Yx(FWY)xxD motif